MMQSHPDASFELLAAIDLRAGRVVRLREGDLDRETVFGDDPALVAAEMVERGVRWLHVVDLDGALTGEPAHDRELGEILASAHGGRVEVGGGIRDLARARALVARGVDRVVFGTAAFTDPGLVPAALDALGPARVVVAVDVRNGSVMAEGWRRAAGGAAGVGGTIARLAAIGVERLEVTAIDRDGTLSGPSLELLEMAVGAVAGTSGRIIASGGIRHVADLVQVRELGCSGAIVGRALYEGGFDLATAVALTRLMRPDQAGVSGRRPRPPSCGSR